MCATSIVPSRAEIRKRRRAGLQARPALDTPAVLPEIRQYYDALFRAHGQQHWWPGRTRFEVIVGAILTQNTSWTNVEKVIRRLRREKLLSVAAVEAVAEKRLAELVRSSGYFRQKAKKLKDFARFVRKCYAGSLDRMFATPSRELRSQLLGVHGIGPETADSILLYAAKHHVFVVDAYTRRILRRHGLIRGDERYEEIRELFERSLPADAELYNEYHALIVRAGKEFCRKKEARCEGCALRVYLPGNHAGKDDVWGTRGVETKP